jgi:hypothetical protein
VAFGVRRRRLPKQKTQLAGSKNGAWVYIMY